MAKLDTPVALIVFNRPEPTTRVFAAVREARPSRLLVIADGPRPDRAGEADRCHQVRQIVSAVDWDCIVETNFADQNLGCRRRVISGLDWVFSRVEEAIILEDDCLPDQSFFPFCAELLGRYRYNEQVGMISGSNPLVHPIPFPHSYFFSRLVLIWGWATWRRVWQKYDERLGSWPQNKQNGLLHSLWQHPKSERYWTEVFDKMYSGTGPNTWDYQMVYTSWAHNWLNVIPRVNLVQNIGLGAAATHMKEENPDLDIQAQRMAFPLDHPPTIAEWEKYARLIQDRFYSPTMLTRVRRKVQLTFK